MSLHSLSNITSSETVEPEQHFPNELYNTHEAIKNQLEEMREVGEQMQDKFDVSQ